MSGIMDALPTDPTTLAGPLPAYRQKLAAGELATDPAQALAAERLQALWVKLRGYDPRPRQHTNGGHAIGPLSTGLWGLLRRKRPDDLPEDHPNGLYLVGEVGRGKSMLMDLFFATADVSAQAAHPFPSVHAGRARPHPRLEAGQPRDARSDPAAGRSRSRPRRRCSASTSSRSTTSPTR